jgi:hypothetical protein
MYRRHGKEWKAILVAPTSIPNDYIPKNGVQCWETYRTAASIARDMWPTLIQTTEKDTSFVIGGERGDDVRIQHSSIPAVANRLYEHPPVG